MCTKLNQPPPSADTPLATTLNESYDPARPRLHWGKRKGIRPSAEEQSSGLGAISGHDDPLADVNGTSLTEEDKKQDTPMTEVEEKSPESNTIPITSAASAALERHRYLPRPLYSDNITSQYPALDRFGNYSLPRRSTKTDYPRY
jgi:hypothetical protein